METTLYGDLPEDFWGEPRPGGEPQPGPDRGTADRLTPASAADLQVETDVPQPAGAEVTDGAVPLFVPTDRGATRSAARPSSRSDPPPAEPEGERFAQLQALFPGRIIEVSRPVSATTAGPPTVGGSGEDAPVADFDGSDDYATAAADAETDDEES